MIRHYIEKLNHWFNSRAEWTQLICYLGFCITFLVMLTLSIRYSHFEGQGKPASLPHHIGKPSGPHFPDSLTLKKH